MARTKGSRVPLHADGGSPGSSVGSRLAGHGSSILPLCTDVGVQWMSEDGWLLGHGSSILPFVLLDF